MEYLTDEDFAVAKANGIAYATAYQRYYLSGWTKENATTIPVNGALWAKWRKTAEKNGVGYVTFWKRLRSGHSPKVAATAKPGEFQFKKKHPFTKEEFDIAKVNGIAPATAIERWRRGWAKDKAITFPVQTQFRKKS
ncbi:hypothetical protein ACIQD3_22585 [Peribacillus loiseleuriae]|uniref:hypothetical protein n=1 Tax=Peribacillus loiseleuriae TaxID=1679170 RepID=UPI0037F743C6